MKCPLFILNDLRAQSGEETEIGDCIQAECAWWCYGDTTDTCFCALKRLALALSKKEVSP